MGVGEVGGWWRGLRRAASLSVLMRIGVPSEIKDNEYRVAMVPAGVHLLVSDGHEVVIQEDAGLGSGIRDEEFTAAGATLAPDAAGVFEQADMIFKVKEPLDSEWPMIREGQVLYTYFHFAADEALTRGLMERGCVCLAYETLEVDGTLPLLTPMSEVAGKMAAQVGAQYLERPNGGRGVLMGGVPGVQPAEVLVLGGGVVGTCAATVAAGMGADVTILDVDLERLRRLREFMPANVRVVYSTPFEVADRVKTADLVVGAVLTAGARAPVLVTRAMLPGMRNGSVIVDVAIDQGGCVETSKPTTHSDPTYVIDGVVHYGVANMPGAVARTSTFGLTNATLPWGRRIAGQGWDSLLRDEPTSRGLANIVGGQVCHAAVADAFDLDCAAVEELVGA